MNKVTAVQLTPAKHKRSEWQAEFDANAKRQGKILETSQDALRLTSAWRLPAHLHFPQVRHRETAIS